MKHLIFGFFVLCLFSSPIAQGESLEFAGQVIGPYEVRKAEAGEILIWKAKNKLLGGTGLAYIEAPPEKVWSFIVAYDEHTKFLPSIVKSDVLERTGEDLRLYTEYKTVWPFANIQMEAQVEERFDGVSQWTMRYKATKTNMKLAYGGWWVRPHKTGTMVYYEMYFDLHYIPHAMISKLSRKAMMAVIDAMRERVLQ